MIRGCRYLRTKEVMELRSAVAAARHRKLGLPPPRPPEVVTLRPDGLKTEYMVYACSAS